ncbi:MAG: hypothetical protein E7329_11680 [Clostridiales bacterium]|nr:hypothetical protein [Clostridiales bacterium]
MKQKHMAVRLESELLDKIAYIASEKKQSTNKLVMLLIRQGIKSFEEQHGEITFPPMEQKIALHYAKGRAMQKLFWEISRCRNKG